MADQSLPGMLVKGGEEDAPCCACMEKRILSTNSKINLAIFGANVGIGLILVIGGVVLIARSKSKMNAAGDKPPLFGTGLWLAIIGAIFVLTSLAPLIIAITAPRATVKYADRSPGCRECTCF
jgi:hypothetical protein